MLSRLSVMKTHTDGESPRHVREREIDYNVSIVYAHVNIRTRSADTFALVCLASLFTSWILSGRTSPRPSASSSSSTPAKRFSMLSTRYEACLITRSVHVQSNCLPVDDRRHHYRDRTVRVGNRLTLFRRRSPPGLRSEFHGPRRPVLWPPIDRPISDLVLVLHGKIQYRDAQWRRRFVPCFLNKEKILQKIIPEKPTLPLINL